MILKKKMHFLRSNISSDNIDQACYAREFCLDSITD